MCSGWLHIALDDSSVKNLSLVNNSVSSVFIYIYLVLYLIIMNTVDILLKSQFSTLSLAEKLQVKRLGAHQNLMISNSINSVTNKDDFFRHLGLKENRG